MAEYATVWVDDLPDLKRGERIVRCRDCRWAHEAPPVDEWHLECRVRPLCRHYTPDDGFCHLGEPKVVDPTTNDVDAEVDE